MSLTEEEAKTKWCPHVVASHTDPRMGFGDLSNNEKRHVCIASECMSWRWSRKAETETLTFKVMGAIPIDASFVCTLSDKGREKMDIKSKWERPLPDLGFCGLAGKP